MRHASIQTTMNIYGRVMNDSKRKANSQIVRLVFGESLGTGKEALSTTALQQKGRFRRPFPIGDNGDLFGQSACVTY